MQVRSNRKPARISLILAILAILAGLATAARAGDLDSPSAPADAGSAMFTLKDVYDKLNNPSNIVGKRTGAFAEPASGTMCNLDAIMGLVTNRAPVPKTGTTIASTVSNDDSELRLGVAWPVPRFTVQADTNCVVDNLTGLMWARNAGMFAVTNWGAAVTNCNDLVYGGHDDWRLPNIRELLSLIDFGMNNPALPAGHPFAGVKTGGYETYWTGSSLSAGTAAWYVEVHRGLFGQEAKTMNRYAWPVRGGAP